MSSMHPNHTQNGSVLLWILVAVALLAGLTAAMNQGSRTSGSMMSDQQARLHAAEIVQYANSIKQAVQRMLMQGISEADISFENDIFTHEDGTPISPALNYPTCTTNACKIFHPEGGAIQARYPPAESTLPPKGSTWKPGVWADRVGIVDGVGTNAPDLYLVANYLKREVCIQINKLLNAGNPDNSPPQISPLGGTYPSYLKNTFPRSFSDGVVENQNAYCFETPVGDFVYIVTLISR